MVGLVADSEQLFLLSLLAVLAKGCRIASFLYIFDANSKTKIWQHFTTKILQNFAGYFI